MQNLFYNISQVLGITVVHSLWQGLILFILLRIFLQVFPATTSAIKYKVAYGTLTAMLLWFAYTLFMQLTHYEWQSTTALPLSPITLPAAMQSYAAPANRYYFIIAGYMPYVTIAYVVGLVFNALRLSVAWNSIYRIRQNITIADYAEPVRRLSKQLNIKKHVEAAFSEWVDVPCVTGFVKPIILLPFSLATHLSAAEIEAILLHELSHIKRNDYLYNFLQQVMGIILFFNPFARLVGKLISEERENCCDDSVVKVTGSPFIYAQALLKLEENKQNLWQLALASSGKSKYELLNRIERIMKTKKPTINIRPILITVLALTVSVTSIAWLDPKIENGKFEVKKLTPAIEAISALASGDISAAEPEAEVFKPKAKKHKLFVQSGDTTFSNLADTIKKKGKYKIIIEDENGDRKVYNSVGELPTPVKEDLKAEEAYRGFSFPDSNHYARVNKFFSSPEWKKQQEGIQKQTAAMVKKFNSPEFKDKMKAMVKKFDSPEWKKQQKEMVAKFNSPEWKAKLKDLTVKFDSPEWKKQQQELVEKALALSKNHDEDSPEFKKNLAEIEKNAAAIGKQFDTPEFRKQAEEYGKSVGKMAEKMVKSKEWKKYQDELIKATKDMTKQFNSPEWKKAMKDLDKQALETVKEAEKAEKAEKKEAVEAKEQAEKAEKTEAVEKTEKVE